MGASATPGIGRLEFYTGWRVASAAPKIGANRVRVNRAESRSGTAQCSPKGVEEKITVEKKIGADLLGA